MATRGLNFKRYHGLFLSTLVTSVIGVVMNWNSYNKCKYPLHIWTVVNDTTMFIFFVLVFVDNGICAGFTFDFGRQQRDSRFWGRVVVLSILALLLYPFLFVWTVVGTLWFSIARKCLHESRQGVFFMSLMFNTSILALISGVCISKWLIRRRVHLLRAPHGIPISEFDVLADMVRVPDWAFEAAQQELRNMGLSAASYHPGVYLTSAQREAVKALIQQLPKFMLKAVPVDCTECCICLEEFDVGNEVRGLPCAHNFHVQCIDQWLRLNVKCPRCRCVVFPGLDLRALSNLQSSDAEGHTHTTLMEARDVRSQPPNQSYFFRLQLLLCPIRLENANPRLETSDTALETAENGRVRLPN